MKRVKLRYDVTEGGAVATAAGVRSDPDARGRILVATIAHDMSRFRAIGAAPLAFDGEKRTTH